MSYSLGSIIKRYRKKNKLTQEELAKAVGYRDRSSITRIESDTAEVSVQKLQKIAEVLNVGLADLLSIHPVDLENPFEKYIEEYLDLTDYNAAQREEIRHYAAYIKTFGKEE